jgi:hypothetical protein
VASKKIIFGTLATLKTYQLSKAGWILATAPVRLIFIKPEPPDHTAVVTECTIPDHTTVVTECTIPDHTTVATEGHPSLGSQVEPQLLRKH